VLAAWSDISFTLMNLKEAFRLPAIAFALEICTRTWSQNKVLQLHVHGWMQQPNGRLRVTQEHLQLPHAKPPHLSLYGQENRRGMAIYAGCFYCACQKHGQVFVRSTATPHVDFQVKHDWVFRLLSAQKISPDVARQHLVQIVTRCQTNMADLQFAEEFMARQSEEAERAVILAKIHSNSKPYRDLPEVIAWATQYDPDNPLDRYKFLVLEGPSSIGKTRFVQGALVDKPEKALILDCSDAVVPALKSNFSRQKHTLVMFDEAHASMIIRCKKLFQASINPVSYGSSPTNAFVHTVWLHGIKLVVASNVWSEEVLSLAAADRQWIQSNSVHIKTDRPLFIQ
jgi:hypothetical protein